MAGHLMFNKKGVSEMVGYVLLIVIALGLSVLVYVYLEKFTPKGKLECPEGVSISIRSAECNSSLPQQLKLEFFNNGLFKVDGIYVKLGVEGKSTRTNLNDPENAGTGQNPFYMYLAPQTTFSQTYSTGSFGVADGKTYILDLQPAVAEKEGLRIAVCDSATISQKITCKRDCDINTDYGGWTPLCPNADNTQTKTLILVRELECAGNQTISQAC